MAYAIVQSKSAQGVGPVTSVAVAFTSNVTSGNEVICGCADFESASGSIPSGGVTDTRSTSYTQRNPSTTGQGRSAIHHGTLATGGACTVTLNVSNASGFPALAIHEVSGLAATPYDQGATATGTGSPTATTGSTTQANELVFAVLTHVGGANQALAVGSGYTLAEVQTNTNFAPIITEHKRVTATGAQTATFAAIASSPTWFISVATFKEAAAGAVSDTVVPPNWRAVPLLIR